METVSDIKALFILVNAGYTDDVMDIARGTGISGATILNARGESARHELVMGITVDSEKEMILCITDAATAEKTMAAIKEKAGIKTPIHGVCFTMPVEKTVGLRRVTPAAE